MFTDFVTECKAVKDMRQVPSTSVIVEEVFPVRESASPIAVTA